MIYFQECPSEGKRAEFKCGSSIREAGQCGASFILSSLGLSKNRVGGKSENPDQEKLLYNVRVMKKHGVGTDVAERKYTSGEENPFLLQ